MFVVYDTDFDEDEYDNFWFDEIMDALSEIEGDFIALADLGLWNGRFQGYNHLGNDLSDLTKLINGDFIKPYVEDDEFKMKDTHHDGTNYVIFRKWKDDINENLKSEISYQWMNHEIDLDEFSKYTELMGNKVKAIIEKKELV